MFEDFLLQVVKRKFLEIKCSREVPGFILTGDKISAPNILNKTDTFFYKSFYFSFYYFVDVFRFRNILVVI